MKPSLAIPKMSSTTIWTTRVIATLWKLAVKRARKLRREAQRAAGQSATMFGTISDDLSPTSDEEREDDDLSEDDSILHEAARAVVATGVVSLADLEAVTGFRLSNKGGDDAFSPRKDDDTVSETATDATDCCSTADSDELESSQGDSEDADVIAKVDDEPECVKPMRRCLPSRVEAVKKPAKWVLVGYGRYVRC
ncbi:hypothetical protein BBJ28_00011543 [Nothophytophthora sp. Chile5]|nr:hypothetical protein BBJ28_00011543 [Nothophytophthora sp. Chile5]